MPAEQSANTICAPVASGPRFPLWGLLALATAAFIDVMTDLLPAGVLPQMSGALHVPPERIGVLVSAFAVASSVAAIPVTTALRGLPRRPVLIGVLTGFAVFNAVTAVSASYLLTFGARLLAGVMGGTLWSMLAGYAARMVPAERRGRATAIVLVGITAAMAAGIPAGAALATVSGWRPIFALLAAVPLLLVAWVRWQVPAGHSHRAGRDRAAANRASGDVHLRRALRRALRARRCQPRPVRLRRRHDRRTRDHRRSRRPPPAVCAPGSPGHDRNRHARPGPDHA